MSTIKNRYASILNESPFMGSYGLLILRVITGLAFMLHGWSKIQTPFSWMPVGAPVPGFLQFLAALSEFGGGLSWLLGLLVPLSSFGLICTMLVAVAMQVSQGAPFVAHGVSYEPAMLYLGIAFFMLFNGPGRVSIDYKLFR